MHAQQLPRRLVLELVRRTRIGPDALAAQLARARGEHRRAVCLGQEERDGEQRDREEEVHAEDPESGFLRTASRFGGICFWMEGGRRRVSGWAGQMVGLELTQDLHLLR